MTDRDTEREGLRERIVEIIADEDAGGKAGTWMDDAADRILALLDGAAPAEGREPVAWIIESFYEGESVEKRVTFDPEQAELFRDSKHSYWETRVSPLYAAPREQETEAERHCPECGSRFYFNSKAGTLCVTCGNREQEPPIGLHPTDPWPGEESPAPGETREICPDCGKLYSAHDGKPYCGTPTGEGKVAWLAEDLDSFALQHEDCCCLTDDDWVMLRAAARLLRSLDAGE